MLRWDKRSRQVGHAQQGANVNLYPAIRAKMGSWTYYLIRMTTCQGSGKRTVCRRRVGRQDPGRGDPTSAG